jgi:hypothetical protein
LVQTWDNIFLLLFPLISFGFSLFFKIINTNKLSLEIEGIQITYNPLGLEKKHANRLNFITFFQLILLFWIGGESLYHPQLIDTYNLFFNLAFIFSFTFGFFWILTDVWKFAQITIRLNDGDLISPLKWKVYRMLTIINLVLFVLINSLNLIFTVFLENNAFLRFTHSLPGTGIESSLPLRISIIPFITIWISPTITILLLFIVYKSLNNITLSDLRKSFEEMPNEKRKLIVKNFEKINKKYFQDLNNE